MYSQTSLVASKIRLQQWTEQIRDCQNRPQGMSVDEWCQQHNISKPNYYYRLRKVREACLAVTEPHDVPAFVELPVSPSNEMIPEKEDSNVAGILYSSNGVRIELLHSASAEFIRNIVGALIHAE